MNADVGILGFGYLGQELVQVLGSNGNVWVTQQQAPVVRETSAHSYRSIVFRWQDPATWSNLPDCDAVLVITIPPLQDDSSAEQARLRDWCRWLGKNRPGYRRCVYLSSTGVYPNLPGIWQEESAFQSDTGKGVLRRVSEAVLSDHFATIVMRPGAIYGDDRNIGRRLLAGKPIPSGEQPVHRIHVHDLARIIVQAIEAENFPQVLNAVDLKPETSKTVVLWLMQQPFFDLPKDLTIDFRTDFAARKFNLSEPKRHISNQKLIKDVGFRFVYPTYKEGLTHAFASLTGNATGTRK